MIYKVYGISDCPACLRAQADLMENDLEYIFVNCDFSKTYRNQIKVQYSWPTFPVITLFNGTEWALIGGSEELRNHLV